MIRKSSQNMHEIAPAHLLPLNDIKSLPALLEQLSPSKKRSVDSSPASRHSRSKGSGNSFFTLAVVPQLSDVVLPIGVSLLNA